MKKTINIWGLAMFIVLIVSACQSDLHDEISGVESSDNELLLEKAQKGNKSYIIQLDDVNLIAGLKGVKKYKDRKNKVKGTALGILKKQGISNPELGFVYSNSIVGFSVKIAPGQLMQLLAADGVKSIHEDKVVKLAPPPGRGRPVILMMEMILCRMFLGELLE